MSDQERMEEQQVNTNTGQTPRAASGQTKKKRYQGYDVEKITNKKYNQNRPWFWKVLAISLILSLFIIGGTCAYMVRGDKKKTDYLEGMNESNTMENLLEGHKNVTITENYSHLVEEKDYTQRRIVTKTKSGDYYSYLKKEQGDDVTKEVIHKKTLYRYDESFPRYVALVGKNYEEVCVPEIEGCVYQNDGKETIEDEKDKGELVNIKAVSTVQDGDPYSVTYGFEAGSQIEKTLIMDKETGIITSATEKNGDEEFYSYTVEFDGETKVPQFYKKIKDKKNKRTCTVYMDYGSDDEKTYTYDVPTDVYFTVMDQTDYKCYVDEDCSKEFSEYQIQVQNPESEITLYMKKEK